MKFAYSLLARFGLSAKKPATPDVFELRLQRIGSRERRLQANAHNLFKSLLAPLEVAARS